MTTEGDGGPKSRHFCFLLYFSDFPILCINPLPGWWARLAAWYCETNNGKELNLNRTHESSIGAMPACLLGPPSPSLVRTTAIGEWPGKPESKSAALTLCCPRLLQPAPAACVILRRWQKRGFPSVRWGMKNENVEQDFGSLLFLSDFKALFHRRMSR